MSPAVRALKFVACYCIFVVCCGSSFAAEEHDTGEQLQDMFNIIARQCPDGVVMTILPSLANASAQLVSTIAHAGIHSQRYTAQLLPSYTRLVAGL